MAVTLDVALTLTEEMLGTAPGDPEVFSRFVESKRPDNGAEDAEVEALPLDEEIEQGTTVFMRDEDGCPFIFNYVLKGFFKDACSMLKRVTGSDSKVLKAYKKQIDGLLFVDPRRVRIEMPKGALVGICERPLRAQTAKGERVALARSETVPSGSVLRFQVEVMDETMIEPLYEWLDYGRRRGLGCWRNSGKGSFTHTVEVNAKAVEIATAAALAKK